MAIRRLLGVLFCFLMINVSTAGDPDRFLHEAREYLGKGEQKAAIIQLKNFLREQPRNGEARWLLGRAYLQVGETAGAVKELERARDLGIEPDKWQLSLAEAYLKNNEPRKVLDNIHFDEDQPPEVRSKLLAFRASANLMLNRYDEARTDLEESLQLDPDQPSAYLGLARLALLERHPGEASDHLAKVLELDPENVEAYLLQAEIHRQKHEFETAGEFYREVLKRQPRAIQALLGSAAVNVAQGKLDQARKDLDKADEIAKGNPQALYLRGLLEFRAQNLDAAKAALEQLLYEIPDHAQTLTMLGVIAYLQNDLKTADKYLEDSHRQLPHSFPVAKILAAVKMKLKQPREAVSLLEPYRHEYGEDPQYLALLGSAYLQNRQFDAGTEALTEAAKLAPDVAAIQAQLGLGELASGNLAKAEGHLEQAIELKQGVLQVEVLLVLAQIKQKKYQQALETAQKLAKRMPDSPMPLNLIASTYMAMGETDKAEQTWKHLLTDYPEFLTAALNLAKLKLYQGDLEEAEKYYRHVLDNRSGDVTALVGLAQVAKARHDTKQMVSYLQQAIDRHPDAFEPASILVRYYLATGDALKALSIARTQVENHGTNPLAYQLLGQAQLAADQAASAVATFRKLTLLSPETPLVWHFLALALERNQDDAGALDAWEEALNLQDNFLPAISNRVRVLLKQKRYDEAMAGAKKIQAQYPDIAAGYFLQGEVDLARQRFKQAIQSYQKSYEIMPSRVAAQRLYQLYRKVGETDKGRAVLESWLEKSPGDAGSWLMLAMGSQAEKRNEKAVFAYEKVSALQPNNVLTLNNLAWLYFENSDPRAMETAERVAELGMDKPEVLDTVGWIYVHNGRVEDGLRMLQESAVKAPHIPAIKLHLAEALNKVGRKEEAAKALKRLLKEYPNFPEREQARQLLDSLIR